MREIARALAPIAVLAAAVLSPEVAAVPLSKSFDTREQAATALRWMALNPLFSAVGRSEPPAVGDLAGTLETEAPGEYRATPAVRAVMQKSLEELPYAAIGRLFFRKPDGTPGTCSAGFTGREDTLVTAAHCLVQQDGQWNTDFLFYRLYGTGLQEAYPVRCVAAPRPWVELQGGERLSHDIGFFSVGGETRAGFLGISKGLPAERLELAGYSDSYYDGQIPVTITAPSFYSPSGLLGTLGNPLGRGSSGTPWTALNTVYSVSSFYTDGDTRVMWGPRVTSGTMSTLEYVLSACSSSGNGQPGEQTND